MSVSKKGSLRAVLAAAILSASMQASAQGALVAPRPLEQAQPPQPVNSLGLAVDGWAVVRYSVLADGSTANVKVVDTIPPAIDTDAIRETAERWTFAPGTSDGDPIDWHNGETLVTFGEANMDEPSEAFTEAYEAISTMLESEQFDAALEASRTLVNEVATQTGELALAVVQYALINMYYGDPDTALHYLQLATDPRAPLLRLEDQLVALQLRLRMEMQLSRVHEALATYDRIAAGLDPDAPDPFAEVAGQLKAHWENTDFIQVIGRIDAQPWRFNVGRRYFYIDNINNGEIQSIDVECDTRRLSIDFQADADYQLPDAFGDCTLFVNGTPGTEFSYFAVLPESE